jgi:hypothetical protein
MRTLKELQEEVSKLKDDKDVETYLSALGNLIVDALLLKSFKGFNDNYRFLFLRN